jgi:hypothetical protein
MAPFDIDFFRFFRILVLTFLSHVAGGLKIWRWGTLDAMLRACFGSNAKTMSTMFYPLVNLYITMENHQFVGTSTIHGHFQ